MRLTNDGTAYSAPDDDWRRSAACVGMNPEDFFRAPAEKVSLAAWMVCCGCPVRLDCLEFALEHADHGLFGGLSADERSRLQQKRTRASRRNRFGSSLAKRQAS